MVVNDANVCHLSYVFIRLICEENNKNNYNKNQKQLKLGLILFGDYKDGFMFAVGGSLELW